MAGGRKGRDPYFSVSGKSKELLDARHHTREAGVFHSHLRGIGEAVAGNLICIK